MTPSLWRKPSALPGFSLTLGITVTYLSLVVLIPLASAFVETASLSWPQFWEAISAPRVLASYRLTFGRGAVGRADQRGLRLSGGVGPGSL